MRSVKLGIIAASLLVGTSLSTPAFATGNGGGNGANQNHTCQGGHNCNTYNTTNNYDNDTYNTYNKGGEGGHGGVGVGYGGEGGSVKSDIDVTVKPEINVKPEIKAYGGDANAEAKAYGGDAKAYGGDAKAYGGSVKNSGNSEIKNSGNSEIKNSGNSEIKNSGNSEIKNSGNSHNYNKNEQSQKQQQQQQQQQQIKNSGNSYNENDNESSAYVNIEEHNKRAPVNTAYAAPLATGEDTCMGSSSIGAQAVSFGLSIGTTWQDDNCRRLKNSRQLVALGYHRAATSLMCVDDDVRQAMIMAGTPCPNGEVVAVVAPPPAREYVPMAPVADKKVRKVRKVRKALPPK
jgi:hypothetical protein